MRKNFTFLTLFMVLAALYTSQAQPVLLRQIPANGTNFTGSGSSLYFTTGDSLWTATSSGTAFVTVIPDSIAQIYSLNLNGTTFFTTAEAGGTTGLWKTNGTASSTSKIGSFVSAEPLLVYNNALYLAINDGTSGKELYKYNGSALSLVKDVNPGSVNGYVSDLIVSNGLLYFIGNFSAGNDIWKSDGTPAGTTLAVDLPFDNARKLTDVNGTIFFSHISPEWDYVDEELWKTDGTQAGTSRVKAFVGYNNIIGYPTSYKGELYFVNNDGSSGLQYRLWKSDGTEAGTQEVAPLISDGSVDYLYKINGYLVFSLNSGGIGRIFTRSDGTGAGTNDFYASPYYKFPTSETATDSYLFFNDSYEDDSTTYRDELYQSDLFRVKAVRELFPQTVFAGSDNLTNVSNNLFFTTRVPVGADTAQALNLWFYAPEEIPSNQAPVITSVTPSPVIVKFPQDSVVLKGTATDSDGRVRSVSWQQVSGPNTAVISNYKGTATVSGLIPGEYVFRFVAKDNDDATSTKDVVVVVQKAGPGIISFTWINVRTQRDVVTFSANSNDTLSFNRNELPRLLNLRANVDSREIKRVVFTWDGERINDRSNPYTVFGDIFGYYLPGIVSNGYHTLTATPYTRKGEAGTPVSIVIRIHSGSEAAGEIAKVSATETEELNVITAYPNPSSNVFNFSIRNAQAEYATVDIYRMDGSLVERLFEGNVNAGEMININWNGSSQTDGMYICKFNAGTQQLVKKIVLKK